MDHNVLTTFRFSDLIHNGAGSYEPVWSLLGIWEDTGRKEKKKKSEKREKKEREKKKGLPP